MATRQPALTLVDSLQMTHLYNAMYITNNFVSAAKADIAWPATARLR